MGSASAGKKGSKKAASWWRRLYGPKRAQWQDYRIEQLPPGCKPVLVFVNTKSGPQAGTLLRRRFLRCLHPLQVSGRDAFFWCCGFSLLLRLLFATAAAAAGAWGQRHARASCPPARPFLSPGAPRHLMSAGLVARCALPLLATLCQPLDWPAAVFWLTLRWLSCHVSGQSQHCSCLPLWRRTCASW